ncbi:MAG: 4-hydroxythreonine-4-phosphate dehydrogenase PdxA [Bacteroidales bacterium]|nr:4-hydroxythreonine-4-phosphate dehydrogenase PdxA [Bacteroidales bacterium]
MDQTQDKEFRIRIGISHGDINGISYEVILKTLQDQRLAENYTIILYGSSKVASYYRKLTEVNELNFNIIKKAEQAHPRRPNILNVVDEEIRIDMGNLTPVAGELAYKALEMAMDDLLKGNIDVLVTAPINKKNIQSEHFHFPGHTEYLADRCKADDSLMLMVTRSFRIGVVTGHIPLNQVAAALSAELIIRKIKLLNESLKQDFGIIKPRIALLALNPHAGDDGLIGDEDQRIIKPAIDEAFTNGILAFGPYPADGFFGTANFREFDAILAMYHDQGMIPFKLLSFDEGVNFTAGLPVVRTSPAHGTAFDIAGKNQANPNAFRHALFQGGDIFTNRVKYKELLSNALKSPNQAKENSTE